MGMATIKINRKDYSSQWRFKRTWIEFHPAIDGVMRRIYLSEEVVKLFEGIDKFTLYDMFDSDRELLSEYLEVA